MKSKSNLLIAMGAVLGLFAAAPAWAQSQNYRIESITRSTESGETSISEPLTAGGIVYFDVSLTDTTTGSTRWTFTGNGEVSGIGDNRPYLQLDMPLRGESVKQSTEGTGDDAEEKTAETNTAVAYYVGQAPGVTDTTKTVLRFAYTVRPGDLAEDLVWAKNAAGNPLFGGDLTKIQLTYQSGSGTTQTANLDSSCLIWANGTSTPTGTIPVNGYTLTVGDGGTDFNTGFLYQGLVPMTISAPAGTVSSFTSTTYANNCYLWLEVQDDDGTWKQVPAGIVLLANDRSTVKAGDASAALQGTFTPTHAGRFIGNTGTFASQRFFVNLPKNDTAYPAGTTVRICYGVNPDTAEGLHGYWEYPITEAPFITANNTGTSYEVTNPNLVSAQNDSFSIDGTAVTNGGTITAGADETFTISIRKQNIDLYQDCGTLYAIVERLGVKSDENKDNADISLATMTLEKTYVPLDPYGLADGTIDFTVPASAGTGEAIYRIRVPELEHMATDEGTVGTIDCPYYLRIQTTSRREEITIQAGEGGYSGQEYYSPLPTDENALPSFLEYTLSVASAADNNRTFLVYPVAADGETQITDDYYYETPTVENGVLTGGRKVQDNIARYAVLQRNGGSVTIRAGIHRLHPARADLRHLLRGAGERLPAELPRRERRPL